MATTDGNFPSEKQNVLNLRQHKAKLKKNVLNYIATLHITLYNSQHKKALTTLLLS